MNKRNMMIAGALIGGAALGIGAFIAYRRLNTIPKGAVAIKPFEIDKYLGKWYEIARLDYRFESNMNHVTAEYSLNEDGSVQVVNRGYDEEEGELKESVGKAIFAGDTDEAKLLVSFFGPFYAGYNVIAIDTEYRYALVAGRNLDYLWLLSRRKRMPDSVKIYFLEKAAELGYNIEDLVWTEQG